jgi:hypothetical protein
VTTSLFEGEALERLRLAAEELAFLTGRGYPAAAVRALVVGHRALAPEQEAVLDRSVCSEPQYRARASREMLPEDIARRPLFVDAFDVVDAITTALAGGVLLEGMDQTMQPLAPGGSPAHLDEALAKIGPVLREMRPSKTRWLLDAARAEAPELADKIGRAAKKWKVAAETEIVPEPKAKLRKLANVVTGDGALIDACKSWCNLAGPVIAAIDAAKRVKLQ